MESMVEGLSIRMMTMIAFVLKYVLNDTIIFSIPYFQPSGLTPSELMTRIQRAGTLTLAACSALLTLHTREGI